MKFYQRKDEYIAAWFMFFAFTALFTFLMIREGINGTLNVNTLPAIAKFAAIFMLFMLGLLPTCLKTVVNNEKIKLCCWFITFRTIYWSEVKQVGIANAKISLRAGGIQDFDYIFISKRFVENPDELNNILKVKDKKNFIFIELASREDVKNAIASYSPVEFVVYASKEIIRSDY